MPLTDTHLFFTTTAPAAATVTLRGGRKPRQVPTCHDLSVAVKSVEGAEAPLGLAFPLSDGSRLRMRIHDGALYQAIDLFDADQKLPGDSKHLGLMFSGRINSGLNPFVAGDPALRFGSGLYRAVHDDGLEEARRITEAVAADLLLVDDELHARSAPPLLCVRLPYRKGGERNPVLGVLAPFRRVLREPPPQAVTFDMSDRDLAEEFVDRYLRATGADGSSGGWPSEGIHVGADILASGTDRAVVDFTALMSTVGSDWSIPALPDPAYEAWLAFRDVYHLGGEITPEAVQALAKFAVSCPDEAQIVTCCLAGILRLQCPFRSEAIASSSDAALEAIGALYR